MLKKKLWVCLVTWASLAGCGINKPAVNSLTSNFIHIYMAGDSTMSVKDPKDYPETGWGMPFAGFFNDGVVVDNRAMNGRSTRTFIEEGRWQSILKTLNAGDYVFIQFGHNDEVESKVDRYTSPKDYQKNLTQFIADVRAAKASPILMSPITRRYFNDKGVILPTHPYSDLSAAVAQKTGVLFIDMDKITREYFETLGNKESALRFNHIASGLHPNYPVGVSDDTHLNELGAREVAQLVLLALKKQSHPLVQQLRAPDPKHLKLNYQPLH